MGPIYCPRTAQLYDSIPAALLIRQVDYWLRRPAGGIMHEGVHWIYHSYRDWQRELLPTMSEEAIRLLIQRRLLPTGALLSWHDTRSRRVYYRLDYARLEQLFEEASLDVPKWVAAGPVRRDETQLSGDVELDVRAAVIRGASGGPPDREWRSPRPRVAVPQTASGGPPDREWRSPRPRVAVPQTASGGPPDRYHLYTETTAETTTETHHHPPPLAGAPAPAPALARGQPAGGRGGRISSSNFNKIEFQKRIRDALTEYADYAMAPVAEHGWKSIRGALSVYIPAPERFELDLADWQAQAAAAEAAPEGESAVPAAGDRELSLMSDDPAHVALGESVLHHLQTQVTRPMFETFLAKVGVIAVEEESVVFGAPNAFVAEMIEQRMSSLLAQALEAHLGRRVDVRIDVALGRGD